MTVMSGETTMHLATVHLSAVSEAGKHTALAAVASPMTLEHCVHAMSVSTEAAMATRGEAAMMIVTVPEGHCTETLRAVTAMAVLAMMTMLSDGLFCVFSRHRAVVSFALRSAMMRVTGPDRGAMLSVRAFMLLVHVAML
jgi:hypothetical protein